MIRQGAIEKVLEPPDSAAVALTMPAIEALERNGTRSVPSPAEGVPVEIYSEEHPYQWPLALMRRETFVKGDYVFRVGDKADKLFFIHKGSIRLPEINKVIRAGQIIGEMGIFSPGKTRTASAICEEELEVYSMDRDEVMQFFSRDPSLAINLMQLSNKRFIENLKMEAEAKERIKSELRIARDIQTSMLPRTFPPFPGRKEFEIYATMDPAEEVGGDFYDFFLIDETRLCVLVGDATGKGVPAALFMAISKALLKSEALRGYSAAEIMSRVNNLLCPENPRCMFVTVFCVILNTETGEVEYCNGGHNAPLRCASAGAIEYIDAPKGKVVGVMENSEYVSRKIVLNPNDVILLYTDGVTEAMNPQFELFSEERLKACLAPLRNKELTEIIAGVRKEIAAHVRTQAQSDDITLLALRYKGNAIVTAA